MGVKDIQQQVYANYARTRMYEYFNPSEDSIALLGVQEREASSARAIKEPAKGIAKAGEKLASAGAKLVEKTADYGEKIATAAEVATASTDAVIAAASALAPMTFAVTLPIKATKFAVAFKKYVRGKHKSAVLEMYWLHANEHDSGARDGTASAIAFAANQKGSSRDLIGAIVPGSKQVFRIAVGNAKKKDIVDHARTLRDNARSNDEWAQLAIMEIAGSDSVYSKVMNAKPGKPKTGKRGYQHLDADEPLDDGINILVKKLKNK